MTGDPMGGSLSIEDIHRAMRQIRDESYEPSVIFVHPAQYAAIDFELRKTRIHVDYEILPGARKVKRAVARVARSRRYLRWAIDDYGRLEGVRVWWREGR